MQRRFNLDALEFQAVRDLLVQRLLTPLGRTGIEALAPLENAAAANRALRQVAELAELHGVDPRAPLPSLKDVRGWLRGFFAGDHLPTITELVDLKRILNATVAARAWLTREARFVALQQLASGFPEVRDLAGELDAVLDDGGEVRSQASAKLARIRGEITEAELGVRRAVQRFLADERIYRHLQNPEPSWRHGRPVFQVRLESRNNVPGVLHDRSSSGATLFIEPESIVAAADQLADARAAEHREVQVILAHVCRGLRRFADEIERAVAAVVELDVAWAKASLLAGGFHVPEVTDDGQLRLVEARHPLLLQTTPAAAIQPLTVVLGEAFHVLVVTGPNTGGKTVVLKTLGLLSLMAQSGVPIPADRSSQVPFFDGVFVDIGDEQGITQNLSTFSSHITRIAGCLAEATPRSLVLLDELGAGTDPEEGGALGYAVLQSLEQRGVRAVVTTHLGRLKDFAYAHQGAENGSMAFDRENHRPLYRLEIGIPGASHALDIADRVGMPHGIVAAARELLGQRDQRLEEQIERVHQARMRAEENRRQSEAMVRDADAKTRAVDERLVELSRRKAWLEEEADSVVEASLREIRARIDASLHELGNAPKPFGDRARLLHETVLELLAGTSVHRRRMKFLGALRRGGRVYVPQLGRVCTVKKLDRTREQLVVEVGRMSIELNFEDVSWLQPLDAEL
ncbi:MAG: hypothetical protein KDC87_01740 [Planctomycetes bacterium]|nr:hypothetical protein [Planctomycetota bacterium]MCB9889741.1 hypothetical protein [Planctomycetota bacterium]